MHATSFPLSLLVASALAGGWAAAQSPSNDAPFNNGGDVIFLYSTPSVGATPGGPPNLNGDLFWRSYSGAGFAANVDPSGAATLEIDGYYEALYDTDWSTPPQLYIRSHGPALPDAGGLGGLEPAFFQLGGLTSETVVVLGSTGFGSPCTIAPSLCSPSGGSCPVPGFVNGFQVDVAFGSTVGSGVVLPADGTSASDLATTYFVHGGMSATGGPCALGDYVLQGVHSTDETAADVTGFGINPYAGWQFAGSGPFFDSIASMVEMSETWRGPVLNPVADSGTGLGVERSDNGGGAMNGRLLGVSGGVATLGVELRDNTGAALPNQLALVGASFTPLAVPGSPVFGASLLLGTGATFRASTAVWQGSMAPTVFVFTQEGVFEGVQVPLDAATAGTDLYLQGLILELGSMRGRTTNRTQVRLH